MRRWIFEPGHTAAQFSACHMMVSRVRGKLGDVHGEMRFDPDDPGRGSVEARIDASGLWTGEPARDDHLRSEDFLHVERFPEIRFAGDEVEALGGNELRVRGELTLRGVTRELDLHVRCRGVWPTPFWHEGEDHGPVDRIGFEARTVLDRHDFGVSWNDTMDRGGVVVGDEVRITLDVEALEAGVVPGFD